MKPKRTILCVDDNDQSLSYRKIMLETRGYRVASYSRGEDALERFKQGGIDLVVTDMAMPGLDGPQLIAAIKSLSPQVPAILIASKVRIYDHESQADVFLTRGMYAPADLLERIRLLLVRKRGPKRMQQRPSQLPRQRIHARPSARRCANCAMTSAARALRAVQFAQQRAPSPRESRARSLLKAGARRIRHAASRSLRNRRR